MNDRWHEIASARHSAHLSEFMATYQEPQVTTADRRVGEWLNRQEAKRRAQEAADIIREDRLEDDSLWTRAPLQPGEWHMQEVEVPAVDSRGRWTTEIKQQWTKDHPDSTPVPGQFLDWIATGRQQLDPDYVKDSAAWKPVLHDQAGLDEWAQATEDDYQGGPVEWDAHTDHYDLTA